MKYQSIIDEQKRKFESNGLKNKNQNAIEIYEQIMTKLNAAIDKGESYTALIFHDGYHNLNNTQLEAVKMLREAGYYVKTGWDETSPGGSDRPFILCSLYEFPKTHFCKEHSLEIILCCGMFLIPLIVYLLKTL